MKSIKADKIPVMKDDLIERFNSTKDTLSVVKYYLNSKRSELLELHRSGTTRGREVCTAYTKTIDNLLKTLFDFYSSRYDIKDSVSTVAVGGYGRGELNLRSDIDIMVVYKRKITKDIEEFTQKMLYLLWDCGLDVGFSIRSSKECVRLAKEDLNTMTSLIDLRHISGSTDLYEELKGVIAKRLFQKKDIKGFIDAKLTEHNERRGRFGGTPFILEPNIKEGEGGLRDFHTALWTGKVAGVSDRGINSLEEGLPQGTLTPGEVSELELSLDFLFWVRNDIHFESERKSETLTFDHQERIAKLFGLENTPERLGVEAFMQRYYSHATNISRLSNIIITRVLHSIEDNLRWKGQDIPIEGHDNFHISSGILKVHDLDEFRRTPGTIMLAFELAQCATVDMDANLMNLILEGYEELTTEVLESPEVAESFMNILRGEGVAGTIEEMHKLKFLECYIPEFTEITAKTQHDRYHVYTVDTHSINALKELEGLRSDYTEEHPLLSKLYRETEKMEILVLGVLFHDIGKGRGKGHAEVGAEMIPEIARRMHLSYDDMKLLQFLVREHLIIADIAQYRDLDDEKLILDFARKVGTLERLNMLYILTFADVRAVGPEVWTQWKGTLFQELYMRAGRVLERGSFELEEASEKLKNIKDELRAMAGEGGEVETAGASHGINRELVEEYLTLLPGRYFISTPLLSIWDHIKGLKELGGDAPYRMIVHHDEATDCTEISILSYDVHGLFSNITGVLAANDVDILDAKIYTMKNGIALDILQISSPYGLIINDKARLEQIEKDISNVVTGESRIGDITRRIRPSILDGKITPKVRTVVEVDNTVSDTYTVLDIHAQDRRGLLFDITKELVDLGLYVHLAKISTKGDSASDIFYVRDIFNQKIHYNEKLDHIVSSIRSSIDKPTGEAPAVGSVEF